MQRPGSTWRPAAVLAMTAGAGVLAGAVIAARRRGRPEPDRWHSVTIYSSPERLASMPPPLDELGFPVEIRIRPAPGDRGTELAARIADGSGGDRVRQLRTALREARSLAEVGEVLRPDAPSATQPTLTGAPLEYATRYGREEGRL
ncbi:hypothetical protein [Dactylosporangium sp. CA-233914]|uniref:hypothetical protein n=1 Tax=Dactylosporangium sp. CA-233914 TaxID=3239934 RepID=UPI003D939C50